MASQTAAGTLDRLDAAHAALLKQTDLQFQLSQAAPPQNNDVERLTAAAGQVQRAPTVSPP